MGISQGKLGDHIPASDDFVIKIRSCYVPGEAKWQLPGEAKRVDFLIKLCLEVIVHQVVIGQVFPDTLVILKIIYMFMPKNENRPKSSPGLIAQDNLLALLPCIQLEVDNITANIFIYIYIISLNHNDLSDNLSS